MDKGKKDMLKGTLQGFAAAASLAAFAVLAVESAGSTSAIAMAASVLAWVSEEATAFGYVIVPAVAGMLAAVAWLAGFWRPGRLVGDSSPPEPTVRNWRRSGFAATAFGIATAFLVGSAFPSQNPNDLLFMSFGMVFISWLFGTTADGRGDGSGTPATMESAGRFLARDEPEDR